MCIPILKWLANGISISSFRYIFINKLHLYPACLISFLKINKQTPFIRLQSFEDGHKHPRLKFNVLKTMKDTKCFQFTLSKCTCDKDLFLFSNYSIHFGGLSRDPISYAIGRSLAPMGQINGQ
jgi:hypothetical protein